MNFTTMEEGNAFIKSLMSKSFGLKDLSPQIVNRITDELLFDLHNIVFQANTVKDKSGCSMLMPRHVDIALKRRNFPPQYGFQCDQNKPFGFVSGGGCDLSFIEESEVDLKKFLNDNLYKVSEEPPEMEIHTHWFAVEGVPTASQEYSSLFVEKLKMKVIGPKNKTSAKKTLKTQPNININLNVISDFSDDSEVSENTESQKRSTNININLNGISDFSDDSEVSENTESQKRSTNIKINLNGISDFSDDSEVSENTESQKRSTNINITLNGISDFSDDSELSENTESQKRSTNININLNGISDFSDDSEVSENTESQKISTNININLNGISDFSDDSEVSENTESQKRCTNVSTESDDTFKTSSYKLDSSSKDLEIKRPHRKSSGLGLI